MNYRGWIHDVYATEFTASLEVHACLASVHPMNMSHVREIGTSLKIVWAVAFGRKGDRNYNYPRQFFDDNATATHQILGNTPTIV